MWSTLSDGTSARCTSTLHTGRNAWRTKGSGKPGFWCGSTHASVETTSKHVAAAGKHNRCVVDAGRFHFPLQRHLASVEYPPPEGHSLVISAETPDSACGSALWKRSATDGEPEGQKGRRKHIKQQPGGTKDDVTVVSSGQKGTAKGANKSTDAKLHNAVLKTLCVLSQQVREVRGAVFMCWMVKQEAPEFKKQRSNCAPTRNWRRPRARDTALVLLQALSERGSTVGSGQRSWCGKSQANVGRFGTGGSIRSGTSLQAGQSVLSRHELVISVAQHREHIRGALGQIGANRLLGQAPSGALERALSAAIEQN